MIRFTCHKCGHRIKAPDEYIGRKGRCPRCGHPVMVPTAEEGLTKDSLSADSDAGSPPAGAVLNVEANPPLGGDPRIRQCPHCGGAVLVNATTCVHCQMSLDRSQTTDVETAVTTPKLDAARVDEKIKNKRLIWTAVFLIAMVLVGATFLAAILFRATRVHLESRGYFYANKLSAGIGFPIEQIVPENVVFCVVVVDVSCHRFAIDQGYRFDPRRFKLILPDGTTHSGAVITLWNTDKNKHMWQEWGPVLGLYLQQARDVNADVNESDAFISTEVSGFEFFAENVIHSVMSLAIGFVLPDDEHKPPLAIQLDSGSKIHVPSNVIKVSDSIAIYDPALRRPSVRSPFAFLEPSYAVQLFEDPNRGFFACRYPCGWTVDELDDARSHWVKFIGAEAQIIVGISIAQGNKMADSQIAEMLQRTSEVLFPPEWGITTSAMKVNDDSILSFIYKQKHPEMSRFRPGIEAPVAMFRWNLLPMLPGPFLNNRSESPAHLAVAMFYSDRRLHILALKTSSDNLFKKWLHEFERFVSSYRASGK